VDLTKIYSLEFLNLIKIYSSEFFKLDTNDQKRIRMFMALVSINLIARSNLWSMENYASVQLIANLAQPLANLGILYFSIFIKRSPAIFFMVITLSFWGVLVLEGGVLVLNGIILLLNLENQQIPDFNPMLRVINLGVALFFSNTILKYRRSVVSEMKKTKEWRRA